MLSLMTDASKLGFEEEMEKKTKKRQSGLAATACLILRSERRKMRKNTQIYADGLFSRLRMLAVSKEVGRAWGWMTP